MEFQSKDQKVLAKYDLSEIVQTIPNFITVLRIIVLPHLIYAFNHQIILVSYVLFLFSIATDLVDGFVARKLHAVSTFGTYLDAIFDFIFIIGMYLNFTLMGIYSPWILFMIIFVFSQFILSNMYFKQTIYDPIGKYYGSLLFGGIGLTLLFSHPLVYQIVTFGIIISTTSTLISRLTYFLRKGKTKNHSDCNTLS